MAVLDRPAVRPAGVMDGWAICRPGRVPNDVLPVDVAGPYGAVPVGVEGETLLVAVKSPSAGGLAAILSTAARRPVRLLAAPSDEIVFAQARAMGDKPAAVVLRRHRLLGLMRALGIVHVLEPEAQGALIGESSTVDPATVLAGLPGGWGLEILGLLEGHPHAHLAATQFAPALNLLLPPDVNRSDESRLVPWRVEGEDVWIACAAIPDRGVVESIERWTGMRAHFVFADRAVLSEVAGGSGAPAPVPTEAPSREDRRLLALARHLGVSLEEVRSRTSGQQRTRSAIEVDADALELLPLPLWRSLGIAPVGSHGSHLDLAIGNECPDPHSVSELVTTLTGYRVAPRYEPRADILGALARVNRARTGEIGHRRRPRRLRQRRADKRPVEMRLLQHDLPIIRLEQYGSVAPSEVGVDIDDLRRLEAVPIGVEDEVLWVAFVDPTPDRVAELSSLCGMTVRPVLAETEAVAARLRTVATMRVAAGGVWRDHPVVAQLEREGRLTKSSLLALPVGRAPLDTALAQTGIVGPEEFASIASHLSGLEVIPLGLQAREEDVVDALGHLTRRQIWDDPVQSNVLGAVGYSTATRRGLLPVRRENDELVVAVVDPFDPVVRSTVDAIEEPVRLGVAPRSAIESALARIQGRMLLGERLLAQGVIGAHDLERALQLHRSTGVRLGRALLALDLLSEEQLAHFVADQQGLAFFRLRDMTLDARVAQALPEETERRLGVLPLYRATGELVVATPDPVNRAALDEVAARTGCSVTAVVCTESDFEDALERLYRDAYLERSTSELVVRAPEESARIVLSGSQKRGVLFAALLLVSLLVIHPDWVGVGLVAACSLFYVTFSLYKSYVTYRSLSHALEVEISAEDVAALSDASLPVYTILVPLYREGDVLPALLAGLERLNYPATKLDVKLLLEEDDWETRRIVEACKLPAHVRAVIVPASLPRNKPKACNYGLIHARGEYVVIYDAEDVPDPDQLKKVVLAFQRIPKDVVCIQAKLNYYNSNQNILTRWFTSEYSMWFDLFLPGLDASGVPIPLGGTSNHFPVARLREVGAWDPYNVTEDADLGLRLFRHGGRTAIVDSTTLEEANSEVYNWIRQRSRWVKGYVQTYLVHMRRPVQLRRAIGTKAFFSFNMVVGGTVFAFLVNPIFWMLSLLWFLAHAGLLRELYPTPVFYLGMLSLVIGNFAFIYLNVGACLRRGHYSMVKYALTSPLYWALMSLAAWKGFVQLWTAPFYWEKTVHGLHKPRGQGAEEAGGS